MPPAADQGHHSDERINARANAQWAQVSVASVKECTQMGYLLDSGNPKILCLLVARAREAVSRNSAGRSPGRRRARAHASDGVLRMPCRRSEEHTSELQSLRH